MRVKQGDLSPPVITGHIPPFVVRPFRVVRTRLKPRTTFLNFGLYFCILIFEFCFSGMLNPLTPPFLKGELEGFLNVVAQFIGRLCLMNQATTKSGGEGAGNDTPAG